MEGDKNLSRVKTNDKFPDENGGPVSLTATEFKLPSEVSPSADERNELKKVRFLRICVLKNEKKKKRSGRGLYPDEEKELTNWILQMAVMGYGRIKKDIPDIVKEILDKANIKSHFINNKPSIAWVYKFLQKHPELNNTIPEYSSFRRSCITEEGIKTWFKKLEDFLSREMGLNAKDFLAPENGSRIYHCSETSFPLNETHSKAKLVFLKSYVNIYDDHSNTGHRISVLSCAAASGHFCKPLVTYPREHHLNESSDRNASHFCVAFSSNGRISPDIFSDWLSNVFFPEIKDTVIFPIILFMDGHSLHLNLTITQFCKDNNIIIYCFPPHTSHLLQPLNISVYALLKRRWNDTLRTWSENNPGSSLSKSDFLRIFYSAWIKATKPKNVTSGFREAGLVPFNIKKLRLSGTNTSNETLTNAEHTHMDIGAAEAATKRCFEIVEENLSDKLKSQFEQWYNQSSDPEKDDQIESLWKIYKETKSLLENFVYQNPDEEYKTTLAGTFKTANKSPFRQMDRPLSECTSSSSGTQHSISGKRSSTSDGHPSYPDTQYSSSHADLSYSVIQPSHLKTQPSSFISQSTGSGLECENDFGQRMEENERQEKLNDCFDSDNCGAKDDAVNLSGILKEETQDYSNHFHDKKSDCSKSETTSLQGSKASTEEETRDFVSNLPLEMRNSSPHKETEKESAKNENDNSPSDRILFNSIVNSRYPIVKLEKLDIGNYEKVKDAENNTSPKPEYWNKTRHHLEIKSDINYLKANIFECSECDYVSKSCSNLKKHELKHSKRKLYNCRKCDYSTNYKKDFKRHELNHSESNLYKCPKCDYNSIYERQFRRHELIHLEGKLFNCSKCDYFTKKRSDIKRHEPIHSKTKRLQCSKCEYATNDNSNLWRHQRKHLSSKLRKCSVRNYDIFGKRDFKDQKLNRVTLSYKCPECDYGTSKKSLFKRHELGHAKTKFKRSEWDYDTSKNNHSKKHELVHAKTTLKCSECDYGTNDKYNLKRHILTHTKTKEFKCSKCDYGTNDKSNFKRHELGYAKTTFKCYKRDCTTKHKLVRKMNFKMS